VTLYLGADIELTGGAWTKYVHADAAILRELPRGNLSSDVPVREMKKAPPGRG
jgi:hypothetical protein